MVHQAAGCGHHRINRAAEGADLLAERRAAHEGDVRSRFHVGSVGEGAFFNLGGNFAGGGQTSTRGPLPGLSLRWLKLLECGQQKGGGFARAGLRRGHDVTLVGAHAESLVPESEWAIRSLAEVQAERIFLSVFKSANLTDMVFLNGQQRILPETLRQPEAMERVTDIRSGSRLRRLSQALWLGLNIGDNLQ